MHNEGGGYVEWKGWKGKWKEKGWQGKHEGEKKRKGRRREERNQMGKGEGRKRKCMVVMEGMERGAEEKKVRKR